MPQVVQERRRRDTRALVGVGVVVIVVIGGILGIGRLSHPRTKKMVLLPSVRPSPPREYRAPLTSQAVQQAHDTTSSEGTVVALSGSNISFRLAGSSAVIQLAVTPSTKYTRTKQYQPTDGKGLKAGSYALISYSKASNQALSVAYDLR
jgi:hypothetical protein